MDLHTLCITVPANREATRLLGRVMLNNSTGDCISESDVIKELCIKCVRTSPNIFG